MWSPWRCVLCAIFALIVPTHALNPLDVINLQADTSTPQEKPSLQLNLTDLSSVASTHTSLGLGDYQCDANVYGNVVYSDCKDAFELIGVEKSYVASPIVDLEAPIILLPTDTQQVRVVQPNLAVDC